MYRRYQGLEEVQRGSERLKSSDRSETKTLWHFPQNVIVFDATPRSEMGKKKVNGDRTKTRRSFKFSPLLDVRQPRRAAEIGLNI